MMILPFKFPTDLRQSIGKNKEKGSLQELIPTRDFEFDEMEIWFIQYIYKNK